MDKLIQALTTHTKQMQELTQSLQAVGQVLAVMIDQHQAMASEADAESEPQRDMKGRIIG